MGSSQRGRVVSPSQVALAQLVERPVEARSAVVRLHQVTRRRGGCNPGVSREAGFQHGEEECRGTLAGVPDRCVSRFFLASRTWGTQLMESSRSSKPMIGVRFPGTSLRRHDREARCLTATQVTSVRIRLSLQAALDSVGRIAGLSSRRTRVRFPYAVRIKPPWSSGYLVTLSR
jgi:hypothetical protein